MEVRPQMPWAAHSMQTHVFAIARGGCAQTTSPPPLPFSANSISSLVESSPSPLLLPSLCMFFMPQIDPTNLKQTDKYLYTSVVHNPAPHFSVFDFFGPATPAVDVRPTISCY
eukprot:EG_transcript_50569